MIEVQDLVKRYGTHTALDHLSFTIDDGGIYGLLGPNGAGKSTTMNILTGYLCANEGTVTVNGHDILKETEKAKAEIGYLPEMPPLYEDMTVREYLEFVCELKKLKGEKIADEVKRISGKTGIGDVLERLIRNLSKGYKQRVGIAQALVGSPAIIILDEPTVGLDPLQIIEIRDLIRELKSEHTVILSSHILSEVSAVCDEILIISNGRLVAKDSAENLSRLSEGKKLLHLVVKGDRKQIEAVLAEFPKIQECRMEEVSEGFKLELALGDGNDIREELFYGFANAHLPILEMSMEHASLEEVFIDLTKDEADNTENKDNTENEQEAAGS
ncbi:MAG: ABC transporter ATP-binding protein [Lachnospiraceae bacterium]|nr:ABC transporter ATP-binding protein [Lachnospiraceae bacterium]